jgi:hypothetical protein
MEVSIVSGVEMESTTACGTSARTPLAVVSARDAARAVEESDRFMWYAPLVA